MICPLRLFAWTFICRACRDHPIDITWPVLPLHRLYSIHHTHNNTALLNLIRTSHRMSWRASFYFFEKVSDGTFLAIVRPHPPRRGTIGSGLDARRLLVRKHGSSCAPRQLDRRKGDVRWICTLNYRQSRSLKGVKKGKKKKREMPGGGEIFPHSCDIHEGTRLQPQRGK